MGLRLLLSAVREELVWIDCEMTGLDLGKDRLIEIAALVTDGELNVLGDGVDVVIRTDDDALSGMIEVVSEMHTRSGLIDEVRSSTTDLAQAEAMVLDYVKAHVPQAKTAPLAGNSIATDRGFIARDMPALDDYLHYRMIDVSSIKELCRRWYPRIYFGQPEKGLTHRALADIQESIRELQFYRRTAFVPPPGHRPARSRRSPPRSTADRPIGGYRFGSRGHQRLISPSPPNAEPAAMVSVVQLVEHQVVVLEVAGSSPVTHPTGRSRFWSALRIGPFDGLAVPCL